MKHFIILSLMTLLLSQPVSAGGLARLFSGLGSRGSLLVKYSVMAGLNKNKGQVQAGKAMTVLARAFPRKIDRRTRYNKKMKGGAGVKRANYVLLSMSN